MEYLALAYYCFVEIDDPHALVKAHKKFFKGRDLSSRIYISEEGINGQMSAKCSDAQAYIDWLKSDERFANVPFKSHPVAENIFPRVTVKYREQIVALDEKVDMEQGGRHLSPKEWREKLESDEEYLLLDVRNQYEWEIGHFEGATLPPIESFREFPDYATQLAEEKDPKKTKVMMYCTGGIRCELYSALLKKRGFEEVYQLEGGVIDYGLKEGGDHWKGQLFVFDDRMAIPIDGERPEPIAKCQVCNAPCDTQYNCANMDCNTLFITCQKCHQEKRGACSEACAEAPRLRPYQSGNKPFRKKHLLAESAQDLASAAS